MKDNNIERESTNAAFYYRTISPWPFVVGAIAILLIMTLAVIASDYFDFVRRLVETTIHREPPSNSNTQAIAVSSTTDSSKVFEAYGRLITILVAFMSVLGVFFGYFVRRSIRETEDDMDKRLTRSLDGWEKERKEIKQEYGDQSAKLEKKIQEVSELENRLRSSLGKLELASSRYEASPVKVGPDVQEAAEIVDELLEPDAEKRDEQE